jgi:hypothetical protein
MSIDALDQILSGGGSTFKFQSPGDTVTGVIENIQVRQVTDFDTGKPDFWDNGDPKQQVVVTLNTDLRDPSNADDDGSRNVYIKGWGGQRQAFIAAVKEAGGHKPAAGDTFTATYIGDGEKPARGYAPKLFKYTVTPGTPGLDAIVSQPPAQAAAPAVQPTQAPAPAQPAAPAAPAGGPQQAMGLAQQLIGLGVDDASIANTTGLDAAVISALRSAA